MGRRKVDYSLYKRQHKNKKIYYSRFRDQVTGELKHGICTGQTRRDDDIRWCENYLIEQKEIKLKQEKADQEKKQNITIVELSQGFWNMDSELRI